MPIRGPLQPMGMSDSIKGLPWHSMELVGKHATILCSDCHAPGFGLPLTAPNATELTEARR